MFKRLRVTLVFIIIAYATGFAQIDTLLLDTNTIIVGEVKSMNKGVLTIETNYSDSDFTIEWLEIKKIYTQSVFLTSLTDGSRIIGSLRSNEDSSITIIDREGAVETEVQIPEIVFLQPLNEGFWSRLDAAVDFGISFTKANNLKQFTFGTNLKYTADKWSALINANMLRSTQDNAEDIRREDASFVFNYFLPKDWYLSPQVSLLSNTEQLLDLRTIVSMGVGNYIVNTNKMYWGVLTGLSYNNEQFSNDAQDRSSVEGILGTELNMFDIKDLSIITRLITYPSISESGRWRVDWNFDLKYDLPLDFYVKTGITLNYDNQPTAGASDSDYYWKLAFGWEW
jgi:putative salt-induced outer membrane protein YdiY